MFQPLEKKRYFEQIADLIMKRIFNEKLKEGYKLPSEQQLSIELNVSRSVVREALRILDVMGHVKIKKGPQGGIFVSSLIHKPFCDSLRNLATNGQVTVDHLFDARLRIEPFIVEEAINNINEDGIQKLLQLKKDGEKHPEDPAFLKQINMEFHSLLAVISGNPVYAIIMKSLIEILIELNYNFLNPVFEKELFRVHSNIIDTIVKKDIHKAIKLVTDDILFVKKNLKKFVNKNNISYKK